MAEHIVIERLDLPSTRDTDIDAALVLRQALDRELDVDGPPIGPALFRKQIHKSTLRFVWQSYAARIDVDGPTVGLAELELVRMDTNRHLCQLRVEVGRDWRRRGIGSRLAARALEDAAADGRTSVIGVGRDVESVAGFWTSLGGERRYSERISRLRLADVDAESMRRWIDTARARQLGYRLDGWTGRCPDHLLEGYTAMQTAMNDAPLDDLTVEDDQWSPSLMRELDEHRVRRGIAAVDLVALDPEGDEVVASTGVAVIPDRPALAYQSNTVVRSDHRRLGSGRWLKAAMYQHLRAAHPDVELIDTANAESNDAMLAINVEMGFREHHVMPAWQGDLQTMLAAARR